MNCRCFVDIGDGDGHGLGRRDGAIGGAYRDVIDIVGAGIGWRFVVGRRFERDGAGRGIDIEQGRIGPRERIGQRCSGIRVGRGSGIDRASAILGKACRCSRGDGRRFVDIGDRDGHGLGGDVGAIRSRTVTS